MTLDPLLSINPEQCSSERCIEKSNKNFFSGKPKERNDGWERKRFS